MNKFSSDTGFGVFSDNAECGKKSIRWDCIDSVLEYLSSNNIIPGLVRAWTGCGIGMVLPIPLYDTDIASNGKGTKQGKINR